MVGDLDKSLWLREIFGSVYGEKRPLCHIGLILHVYASMPFTRLKSTSSTYILDFQGMSSLKFLGHTNHLY